MAFDPLGNLENFGSARRRFFAIWYTRPMAPRRRLGLILVAALSAFAWTGCDDGSKGGGGGGGKDGKPPSSADLMTRCEQLGKACGDNDKRVEKIVAECKQAAANAVTSGCTEKAFAAHECYEKELCGKGEPVWALDDLRVLSERHGKCVAERDATQACVGKE